MMLVDRNNKVNNFDGEELMTVFEDEPLNSPSSIVIVGETHRVLVASSANGEIWEFDSGGANWKYPPWGKMRSGGKIARLGKERLVASSGAGEQLRTA